MLRPIPRHRIGGWPDRVKTPVVKYTREGTWFGPTMDKIAKEGKKHLEKSAGSSKKGSSGSKSSSKTSGSKKGGGGSGADKAKRAAKEFLK